MKSSIVLLSLLMALSLGVAFGEKTLVADKAISTNELSLDKNVNAKSGTLDAADAGENESVDQNENGEDGVTIDGVTFSPSSTYIELKNNETAEQNLTGWKLNVLNKTVFTFPQFTLGANALVKVHAGVGENSKTDLYAANSLITKADDEVCLLDASGEMVSSSEESNEKSDSPEDA
jgi:hypothetical protein